MRMTFYPFNLIDVPPVNTLPDPYSDDDAQTVAATLIIQSGSGARLRSRSG